MQGAIATAVGRIGGSQVLFEFKNELLLIQGSWINPGFKGKAGSRADIQGGRGVDQKVIVGAVKIESRAHFTIGKAQTIHQDAVVAANDVIAVALSRPPSHQARGWWRAGRRR